MLSDEAGAQASSRAISQLWDVLDGYRCQLVQSERQIVLIYGSDGVLL